MTKIHKENKFKIKTSDFNKIKAKYQNMGKNGDIGKRAVSIVELFFRFHYKNVSFPKTTTKGADLSVKINGRLTDYEIKGTAKPDISWNALSVSSRASHSALKGGMELIRVFNVGAKTVDIVFLKYNVDFTMKPEARWVIKEIK